jgi:hypothetical protein
MEFLADRLMAFLIIEVVDIYSKNAFDDSW